MGWLDEPLTGFDTETTGVSVANDRIVSAAVIVRSGVSGASTARTWLIDPGIEIPAGATAVHGITTEHVRSEGLSPTDALPEIASEVAAALNSGTPVVGFNVAFDLAILEADLIRHGLPTLASLTESSGGLRPIVDPLVLDRHLDRWRKGKRTLSDMCAFYGVSVVGEDLHAADVDVAATIDLLAAMSRTYPTLASSALADLHDQQVEAHRVWAESFRAWLISKGRTEDLPEVEWPVPTV